MVAARALALVRIGLVTALAALLAVVASGTFDQVVPELFVPVLITGAMGAAAAGRRAVVRLVGASAAVVVGVVIAVVLAGGGAADVARSVVDGPRQLLTTEWPSPVVPTIVGAVASFLGVVTALAADLAGRRRYHLAALAVIAAGWIGALAMGAPTRPATWVLVVSAAVAFLFTLARDERHGARRVLTGDRTVVASVVAVAVVGVATAGAVAWADRADPRQTDEAEVSAPLLDPVEAVVALRRAVPSFDVFSVADRSRVVGQSLPARWRLAALDTYDGQRWVPTLELRPIGGSLGQPAPPDVGRPPGIDYRVEYRSDDIDLLPFPGPPLSVSVGVETDEQRVVVRPLERPDVGSRVTVASDVALTSRSPLTGLVERRAVDEIAGGFTDAARRLGRSGTEIEQLVRIEATMRDEWQLDRSSPGAGQQLALIERFVVDTNRGTDEQFVTAFVLLARSLGIDARVASGFVVPPADLASPLALRSDMAATWPEVNFQDAGWVAFDPIPSLESSEEDEQPPQPDAQTPAAAQPPIAPPADVADEADEEVLDVAAESGRWASVRGWLVRVGTVGVLGVLPFAVAIATIVGLKLRRRRRRLADPDPVRRIQGAWANVTDGLVDAGLAIAPSWTDHRIAAAAVSAAPAAPHELRRLASMATRVTFGPTDHAASAAADAALSAERVDQAIRHARSRWGRIRWWLSVRSLRRSTRSPVVTG